MLAEKQPALYPPDFISQLDGVIDSYIDDIDIIPKLFAVKFLIEELTENDDNDCQYKLDIDRVIIDEGISVEKIIFDAEKLNVYRVVEPEDDSLDLLEGTIRVFNECNKGDTVLLYSENKLYGPFKAQVNRNNEMTVAPNIRMAKTPFVVDYWDDIESHIAETQIKIFRNDVYDRISLAVPKNKKQEDLITENDLIESVAKILVDSDNDSNRFLSMLSTESPLFASTLSDNIINNRKEKALDLFKIEESRKEILKQFSEVVSQNDIADVFKDKVVSRELYNNKQSDLEKSQLELKDKQQELEALQKDNAEKDSYIAKYEEEKTEKEPTIDNQEYDILLQKYQELEKEKNNLEKEYSDIESKIISKEKLDEEIKKLENLKETREGDARKADNEAKEAEEKVDKAKASAEDEFKKLPTEYSRIVDAAFDPVLSNALLEAASRFNSDNEQIELDKKVSATNAICEKDIIFKGNNEELLSYIVSNIQKYRNYSFNEIVNILICITQNFLTVFSGNPGIGKTSICNIIANSLGLNLFDEYSAPNRYILVSVEKGWATKRDLIGYYNPLTRKYDKSNSSVYNGLMLLDKEAQNSSYPFIILLDEANLSQMEYYWADFMNIADKQLELPNINIGSEKSLVVPNTLRFLATLNNDETTVDLSPRLIDRAWVIHLPNDRELVNDVPSDYKSVFNKIVSWKSLCDIFEAKTGMEMDDSLTNILEGIYKIFGKYRYTVSPRMKLAIRDYVLSAKDIMEDETGIAKNKIAIDYAVIQKLLPKINGIYDDRIEKLLGELKEQADKYNLKMTQRAIEEVMYRHQYELDMGYCSFMN